MLLVLLTIKLPEAMKVIFLDIDGVVLPFYRKGFDESKMILLKEIVLNTDAKIVLSSNWRLTQGRRDAVINELEKFGMVLYSCTGYQRDLANNKAEDRGIEIKQWLRNRAIETFVVIDDLDILSSDPDFFKGKTILTNGFIGLTKEEADVATKILSL